MELCVSHQSAYLLWCEVRKKVSILSAFAFTNEWEKRMPPMSLSIHLKLWINNYFFFRQWISEWFEWFSRCHAIFGYKLLHGILWSKLILNMNFANYKCTKLLWMAINRSITLRDWNFNVKPNYDDFFFRESASGNNEGNKLFA